MSKGPRAGMKGKRHWQWAAVLAAVVVMVSAVAFASSPAANLVGGLITTKATLIDIMRHEYVGSSSGNESGGPHKQMDKPLHYDSSDSSEKVTTLPVPVAADKTHKRVIFSLAVPDLAPGDVLQVMSEFQVTNDLGYNVMCMSQIILADSQTAVSGTEITEANGRNVTPAAHHDSFSKLGSLTVTTTGTKYVNVVAWSAASNATTDARITVDTDYGRLSIIRY